MHATEPRTARAPLGNKTTNAKARATQPIPGTKPVAREVEKTIIKPSGEDEIEYAPPKPKDLPYESDVFPDGVLTFEGLKPENLFKGYYQYYHNRVDGQGKTAMEREMEQRQKRSFERGEAQIRKDMEEFDWSIGDIPESKNVFKTKSTAPSAMSSSAGIKAARPAIRQPSTIASRKAASALAMAPQPRGALQPRQTTAKTTAAPGAPSKGFLLPKRKPIQKVDEPSIPAKERVAAAVASRSTVGYNKGRSVSSLVHSNGAADSISRQPQTGPKPRTLVRSVSSASTSSEATITPARFAQASSAWKKPDFLSIFDADDDEDGLGGGMPPVDDDDEDFQLTVKFE